MIIGITGSIGSGKSRVARFWSTFFELPLLDLDCLCRQLLEQGEPGWLALQARFGHRFFARDGSLDRVGLRGAIFQDDALRHTVDATLHPVVRTSMHKRFALWKTTTALVEIPLLFEAGWQQDVDRIVVVTADRAERSRRIMARDGVGVEESVRALSAQEPLEDKVLAADHVIENGGWWVETCLQVLHLGRLYVSSNESDEERITFL